MKKTIFLIAAALITAVSITGCSLSKNAENNTKTAEEQAVDNASANADKKIDMSKVEGTDAKTADDANAKGKAGDTEVKITDAKVIKYGEQDVIVVSYEFKNKTGEESSFEANIESKATQNGEEIAPAVVVGVEGISCETLSQRVKNGDEIKVQKAFRLHNLTEDVTVTADDIHNISASAPISKTFKIAQ